MKNKLFFITELAAKNTAKVAAGLVFLILAFSAIAAVCVPFGSAPSCSIHFSPALIKAGDQTVLSWGSYRDEDGKLSLVCTSSIDGNVFLEETVGSSGTKVIRYDDFSSYLPLVCTLTAENDKGTSACSATLAVGNIAERPTCSVDFNPSSISSGESSALSWSSERDTDGRLKLLCRDAETSKVIRSEEVPASGLLDFSYSEYSHTLPLVCSLTAENVQGYFTCSAVLSEKEEIMERDCEFSYSEQEVTIIGQIGGSYAYSDMLLSGNDICVALVEYRGGGAGYQKVRIFKSSDQGENWIEKGTIIEGSGFHGWVRLRKEGDTLYASVANVTSGGASRHLLRSSDDGATWGFISPPGNLPDVYSVEVDILPLGGESILVAYLDSNGNVWTATTSNNGSSWNERMVAWGRPCTDTSSPLCPVYTYPRLARQSNGRIHFVYGQQQTITAEGAPAGYPRGFVHLYSDNQGQSWTGNWRREIGKFPHSHPELGEHKGRFQVTVPMHNIIDGASRFILSYVQHEFLLPESMGYTLAFKQSGMAEGSYVAIYEADGREEEVIFTSGGTTGETWKFAASQNGQYLAFVTLGCVVAKSDHHKHYCENAVDSGSLLVYSIDGGKKWYYVVLPDDIKGVIGSLGYDSYAGLQITDGGQLLMSFPDSSELKFLCAQLEVYNESGGYLNNQYFQSGSKPKSAYCTDSDGGINPDVKGTVSTNFYDGSVQSTSITAEDCCADASGTGCYESGPKMFEWYCSGSNMSAQVISCANGCFRGACVP